MSKKNIEDVSIIMEKRKGKTLIQNLFKKILDEYGETADDKMLMAELAKVTDTEFDELLK